jgi:hypothetical protein
MKLYEAPRDCGETPESALRRMRTHMIYNCDDQKPGKHATQQYGRKERSNMSYPKSTLAILSIIRDLIVEDVHLQTPFSSLFSVITASLSSLPSVAFSPPASAPASVPAPTPPSLWIASSGFAASNLSLVFASISSRLGTTHLALSHGFTPMRYMVSISSSVRPWPSMTKKYTISPPKMFVPAKTYPYRKSIAPVMNGVKKARRKFLRVSANDPTAAA